MVFSIEGVKNQNLTHKKTLHPCRVQSHRLVGGNSFYLKPPGSFHAHPGVGLPVDSLNCDDGCSIARKPRCRKSPWLKFL